MTGDAWPCRVCVTGPESTGKTTLARRLAAWGGTAWVAEASRGYAEDKGADLDASDVGAIARAQMRLEDEAMLEARARRAALLVLDTDLVSTCVYAAHYYGVVPPPVDAAATARIADLYLLCDVDVPWIPDGIRDRPVARAEMFARFATELARRAVVPVIVRGSWDERWTTALAAVNELLERRENVRERREAR